MRKEHTNNETINTGGGNEMSFASISKQKELGTLVKVIDCFGIVEARQLRQLFSHLPDQRYGPLMARLHREGLTLRTPDGLYLKSAHRGVSKIDRDSCIRALWVFILIKKEIVDFSAGVYPVICSVSANRNDYDLIAVNENTIDLINDHREELNNSVVRLFIAADESLLSKIIARSFNDFVLIVGPDGVTDSLKLGGTE